MSVTVTAAQVRDRAGASDTVPDQRLADCVNVVTPLLAAHTADYDAQAAADPGVLAIPDAVRAEALLASAVELFHQQKAPNGVLNQQYAADDGSVGEVGIRISADPLRPAYPLLGRWVDPVVFA